MSVTDPNGRQPIGIEQPPHNGALYPFVAPSDDILQLLGDLYLGYEDNTCKVSPPLKVAWMYGFGTDSSTNPPGFPEPTHSHDILITDSNDLVVFDSTKAGTFVTLDWGSRLKILKWQTDKEVCHLTMHTAWGPDDTPRTYKLYITPANGELDPRTYERIPLRVTSIRVGLQKFTGNVVLSEGYNTSTVIADSVRKDGGRRIDRIILSGDPGSGLGRSPGCEETTPFVRRINGKEADEGGNFILSPEECYHIRIPVDVGLSRPYMAEYSTVELTEEQAKSALQLRNDCMPCCECNDYARTYKGLQAQFERWSDLGNRAIIVRDTYHDSRSRWLEQKSCREENAIRVITMPLRPCRGAIAAAYCNFTAACLAPIEFRFTFQLIQNNQLMPIMPPPDITIERVLIDGPATDGEEPAVAGGKWPIFKVYHDLLGPQEQVTLRLWFHVEGCTDAHSMRVDSTVHIPDPEPLEDGTIIELPTPTIDSSIVAIWDEYDPAISAARSISTKFIPLQP